MLSSVPARAGVAPSPNQQYLQVPEHLLDPDTLHGEPALTGLVGHGFLAFHGRIVRRRRRRHPATTAGTRTGIW